jgi:hypothetical protein
VACESFGRRVARQQGSHIILTNRGTSPAAIFDPATGRVVRVPVGGCDPRVV